MPEHHHALELEEVTKTFARRRKLRLLFRRDPGVVSDSAANAADTVARVKPARRTVLALDHVSLTVAPREIYGVLGPNGSGKSTLIRILSTLLIPDSGRVSVLGRDVLREPLAVKHLINRVSVEAAFFKKLSPLENLMFSARLHGLPAREARNAILDVLSRLRLDERAVRQSMETLSRGMQQKVAVARALLTRPPVLLLDEPTTGLDPRSKREVQQLVRELRDDGTTVLLTTHDMVEAEALCDRIAIIDGGRIVADGTAAELKDAARSTALLHPSLEDAFIALTGHELETESEAENEPAPAA